MGKSAEVANAGKGKSPSLSEDQVAEFWARIVSNLDAGRGMAGEFVLQQSVDDVVHSAALRFLTYLHKRPAKLPATENGFRRKFLSIVRNHAIDCIRVGKKRKCRPMHAGWNTRPEPTVGGRHNADRELNQIFAENHNDKYDAPAPAEIREEDQVGRLALILGINLDDMPLMQHMVIYETFIAGHKRAEVAETLGISVKTYDSHLQAAFRTLRHLLALHVDASKDPHRPRWDDLIVELRERYEAGHPPRTSGKKGERSNLEGERSTLEVDRGKSVGSAAA